MMDMNPKTERIRTFLGVLAGKITKRVIFEQFDVEIADCGYREDDSLPDETVVWRTFEGVWAGEERDSHYWFRFAVDVPEDGGNYRLNFETSDNQWKWDDCDNPQMLVYVDGKSVQALDWNHRYVSIEGGHHEIYIYAHTGCWVNEVWADETRSFLLRIRLTEHDLDVQGLYYDIKVPFEAAETMDDGDYNRERILTMLNEALTLVDMRDGSVDFSSSILKARQSMAEEFYGKLCQEGEVQAILTGHAHIDIAWLWPARQAREKSERTFTTMQHLMDKYPNMHFYASSPVLYKWLKQHSPELYQKIRERITDGRWEADCGAWLEPDLNMPSGESLLRQFLYGKKFLKEEFDIDSHILWVPDCFGFTGSLPQIMKGCGIDQLVTNKLCWNDMNKMPHDAFMWRGIDGSEVYAYFMTAQDVPLSDGKGNRKSYTTYASTATPSQVIGAWEGFREKEITSKVHLAFGFGDGGGGPSEEQIEYVDRMSHGIPGVPTAKLGSVKEFLSAIRRDMDTHADICPKWDGELYFEFHRGVFTSVAKNKKYNRQAEFGMQNAEWLSVAGNVLAQSEYPKQLLDECWKKVLEYQFHDILPGSSIREAYEETDIGYAKVFRDIKTMETHMKEALKDLFPCEGTVVWNHTPFMQSAPVRIGNECVIAEEIPAHGYKLISSYDVGNSITVTENGMENNYIRVMFDEKKRITSIYDKCQQREVIPEGRVANRLMVYDDIPTYFDAWEIRRHYRMKSYEIDNVSGCEVVRDGCRSGLKITRKYLNSSVSQIIWMYENSAMLEFDTEIDWQCQKTLLKVEFPVDINTTRAICDAPFGSVERSITQNTTWEQAKFEVCAHKYVDLSEGNYGVALITDCKYGYSFKERQMEISLLRTPKHPYPEADMCVHKIRYALYPHAENFYNSDVVQKAYVFNNPLVAESVTKGSGQLPASYSFVSCTANNVAVDTIKQSEDGRAIIVRAYEFGNTRTNAKLSFGFPVDKVMYCNMLEEELEELCIEHGKLSFAIKPFEVVTFKIYAK